MRTRLFSFTLIFAFAMIASCASLETRTGRAAYVRGDYQSAIAELTPFAEQGNPEAQYLLGASYANASPPEQDYSRAERWLKAAAEQGHTDAMVDIAKLNLFYKDERDVKKAISWYMKAADLGHPEGQFMTGTYYFSEDAGAEKNNVKAYMWWLLSASKGHKLAKLMLDKSLVKISPDEVQKAEKLAKEWKAVK